MAIPEGRQPRVDIRPACFAALPPPLTIAPCRVRGSVAGSVCPLAFGLQQAQHSCMTPGVMKHKPTAGARRAAGHIEQDPSRRESTADLIDRETGLRELVDIVEEIIAEA